MTNGMGNKSVVLQDVRKSYGNLQVVHGIDLTIAEGEFVVFVGPSGCGKSTLLRMIAGLEDVTDGRSRSRDASSPISIHPSAASPWSSNPTRSIRI